ncbi:MAG: helix-turn-helix domain-containing protein [Firmicutes bacterium]|nr:helix-turn-helix domain-containing protein [Bacillota bacterium]
MDITKTGNQIARLRREKGLTGERLAEALMVSPQAVSKWENGRCLPETALLPALAEALPGGEKIEIRRVPAQQHPQRHARRVDNEDGPAPDFVHERLVERADNREGIAHGADERRPLEARFKRKALPPHEELVDVQRLHLRGHVRGVGVQQMHQHDQGDEGEGIPLWGGLLPLKKLWHGQVSLSEEIS